MHFEGTQVYDSKGAKSAKENPWNMAEDVCGKLERKEGGASV